VCLIVVGALAPLCFLFAVFRNARPPATPRRPTHREIKNALTDRPSTPPTALPAPGFITYNKSSFSQGYR